MQLPDPLTTRAGNNKENELPVDQHQPIALMAPRLAYVASASEDAWDCFMDFAGRHGLANILQKPTHETSG